MSESEYALRIIKDYILKCDEEVMWSTYNEDNKDWNGPIKACVMCSDTFAYACADAEGIRPDEIDELISFSKEGERRGCYTGDIMWVCKKRNIRPLAAWWGMKDAIFKNWLDEVVPYKVGD